MADFYLNAGDTASPIFETLEDETGTAVNIQGAAVKLTVTPIHGGTPTINDKPANNLQVGAGSDGSLGQVSYGEAGAPYAAGETSTAGDYLYVWKVTYAGGAIQSFPNDGYRLLTITGDAPTAAQEYVSTEELKKELNLSGTSYANESLRRAVQSASKALENITGRRFTLGSAGEARVYHPVSPYWLYIDDVTAVTAVTAGTSALTVGTHYSLEPTAINITGPPYDVLRAPTASPMGSFGNSTGWADVTVTGTYGWPTVPAPIQEATMILASRYLQRTRSAPFGILTFGDGGEAARLTRSDPDFASLVGPYIRSGMVE